MNIYDAADMISKELSKRGYQPSDGTALECWDRIFFGQPLPKKEDRRPCPCGGTLLFYGRSNYITGQWQCDKCTRLHQATIAETIGALMKQVEDVSRSKTV